jgi:hypothetical protein
MSLLSPGATDRAIAVADVFVAGNHLWYPEEDHPAGRSAST